MILSLYLRFEFDIFQTLQVFDTRYKTQHAISVSKLRYPSIEFKDTKP